jgi:hypothetical protein
MLSRGLLLKPFSAFLVEQVFIGPFRNKADLPRDGIINTPEILLTVVF